LGKEIIISLITTWILSYLKKYRNSKEKKNFQQIHFKMYEINSDLGKTRIIEYDGPASELSKLEEFIKANEKTENNHSE
jgi:hypothetical protein